MEDAVSPDLAKKPSEDEDNEPKKPQSSFWQIVSGLVIGGLPAISLIVLLSFFRTSFTVSATPFVLSFAFWISLGMVVLIWLICFFVPARRILALSILPTLVLSLLLFAAMPNMLPYLFSSLRF